jgi:hypothetical protein
VKCAKCSHKWFQKPPSATPQGAAPKPPPPPAVDFGLDESSFPPPPTAAEPEMDPTVPPITDFGPDPLSLPDTAPGLAAAAAHAFSPAGGSDLDLDDDAPPIPPKPSKPAKVETPKKKRGTIGLWLLLVLFLLVVAGGLGYWRQDTLVAYWPPLENYLIQAHLRHEKLGAGLEMRNAGVPERSIAGDVNILIVRGIIANISDRPRDIPTLKLALFDKDDKLVQEKLAAPPIPSLMPGATSSFKIILERPDPEALSIKVQFDERPVPTQAQPTQAQPEPSAQTAPPPAETHEPAAQAPEQKMPETQAPAPGQEPTSQAPGSAPQEHAAPQAQTKPAHKK